MRATTHGEMEVTAARAFCAATTAYARERDCLKVLIDHRDLIFHLSTMDIFQMNQYAEELGLRRFSRIAFVMSQEKSNRENFRFFENVFVNRGYGVKIFIHYDQALQWLLETTD